MKKLILAVLGVTIFGKMIPLILTALLIVGGILIVITAVKEGKQL